MNKDSIFYENRFFIRLQELFSEYAQKKILPTERAEIYYFINIRKYKLFIKKSRKNYQVCGKNFEILNKLDMFENVEIKDVKQWYNIYFEGTWKECITKFEELLQKGIENGLLLSNRTTHKRQKRKSN